MPTNQWARLAIYALITVLVIVALLKLGSTAIAYGSGAWNWATTPIGSSAPASGATIVPSTVTSPSGGTVVVTDPCRAPIVASTEADVPLAIGEATRKCEAAKLAKERVNEGKQLDWDLTQKELDAQHKDELQKIRDAHAPVTGGK